MVEGGMRCVKYILFGFNLIFFLVGLGLIISGAVVQTKFSAYLDFFGGSVNAAAIVLIVIGAIIFIIGFFGCCGAYKENYCMTMTFAVLLALIFILLIGAGIGTYIKRDSVHDLLQEKMEQSMDNFGKEDNKGVTKSWNMLQHEFKCCGVTNYTDWEGKQNVGPHNVPDSCCTQADAKNEENCGKGQLDKPTHIYRDGCLNKLTELAVKNLVVIGGVGIGLAFIMIVGILLACCLARTIKKEYEVV
jgi:CD63 antigen